MGHNAEADRPIETTSINMPPVLGQPIAIGTLPHSLSTKFSESNAVLMNINEYHDGASQRKALVTSGRRSWKISKRLDAVNLGLLSDFYDAAKSGAFYFFNPSETVPRYSANPVNTSGRYLVRFNSDWSQTTGMGRSDCEIELIEVSEVGATDIGAPIVPDDGPGGGGTPPPAMYVPIDAPNDAIYSVGPYSYRSSPISYGGFLWIPGMQTALGYPNGGVYRSTDGATWAVQGASSLTDDWQNNRWVVNSYWDGTSSIITLILTYPSASPFSFRTLDTLALVNFDMSTATYVSHTAMTDLFAGWAGFPSTIARHFLLKLSNGTFRIVFDVQEFSDFPPTGSGLYYADYAAGAWTAVSTITAAAGKFLIPAAAIQDGDIAHLIYGDRGSTTWLNNLALTPQTGFYYQRLSADGTAGTAVSLDGILGADGSTAWYANSGIISGNAILVAVARQRANTTVGDASSIGVLVGSPKGSPTFAYVQVSSLPSDAGLRDMKLIHLSSGDYLGWVQHNPSTGNLSQIYVSVSTNSGSSWSTPQLLVDLDANPPTAVTGQDTLNIYGLSLGTQLDGSSLGIMFSSWVTYWTSATPA